MGLAQASTRRHVRRARLSSACQRAASNPSIAQKVLQQECEKANASTGANATRIFQRRWPTMHASLRHQRAVPKQKSR